MVDAIVDKAASSNAQKGVALLSRLFSNYLGLILLVVIAVVSSLSDVGRQARDTHIHLAQTTAPGLEATPGAPAIVESDPSDVAAAEVIPNGAHERTVAFLESMADGLPAEKLPVAKVSATQAESLRRYITKKYRVSNEATRMLISTAYGVGQEMGVDPLLLLAVMAIESGFNPFAESNVGAQGLMQVLTKVHMDKFATFGGEKAAWNPVANIHVGALILKDCIVRSGSLVAGLRMYAGSAADNDSPYGNKVLAERRRLASAAGLPPDLPGAKPVQRASADSTNTGSVAVVPAVPAQVATNASTVM